jgi:hypothetical protein
MASRIRLAFPTNLVLALFQRCHATHQRKLGLGLAAAVADHLHQRNSLQNKFWKSVNRNDEQLMLQENDKSNDEAVVNGGRVVVMSDETTL